MKKISGITLIALPFALVEPVVYPFSEGLSALAILGIALLWAGMIIGGVELIDSHNARR